MSFGGQCKDRNPRRTAFRFDDGILHASRNRHVLDAIKHGSRDAAADRVAKVLLEQHAILPHDGHRGLELACLDVRSDHVPDHVAGLRIHGDNVSVDQAAIYLTVGVGHPATESARARTRDLVDAYPTLLAGAGVDGISAGPGRDVDRAAGDDNVGLKAQPFGNLDPSCWRQSEIDQLCGNAPDID